MSNDKNRSITQQSRRSRIGQQLQTAALALLLLIVCGRCFVGDMPFRSSAIKNVSVLVSTDGQNADAGKLLPDRSELSRVSMAMLTLVALAIWAVGVMFGGEFRVRLVAFAAIAAAFAMLSAAGVVKAADQRGAWDSWFEQSAYMLTCFLAAQLCADRRRYTIAIVIIAATAITLGIKGMLQAGFEFPIRIAQFSEDKVNLLQKMGYDPASPQARAFEARAMDDSVYGFLGLSNPFASIMLTMLGVLVGLAVDKFIFARRYDKENAARLGPGRISSPMMAAALTVMMIVPAVATLYYTRSRGAMLSLLLVSAATAMIFFLRRRLADKWRRVFLTCVCLVAIGIGGVAAWGLKHDSLPGKSMTFRWFYWTASAKVVADSPFIGVGAGNFGGAYLAHRRAEAEEAIKSPHNTLMQAACEYGLLGGTLFLAAIMAALYFCAKVVVRTPLRCGGATAKPSLAYIAIFPAWFVVMQLIFGGTHDEFQMIVDLILPAGAMAAAIWICRWTVWEKLFSPDRAGVFMLAGLAAFFIHSMLEVSFWMPASAGVFWLIAGVCASQADGEHENSTAQAAKSAIGWKAMVLIVMAIAAAGYALWLPVAQRDYWTGRTFASLCCGDTRGAVDSAVRASSADPLDYLAAADAANVIIACGRAQNVYGLDKAYELARQAVDANRRDVGVAVQAGRLAGRLNKPLAAAEYFAHAVAIDPNNSRLRIEAATAMQRADKTALALEYLSAADRIDAALRKFNPESVECLTASELETIKKLKSAATSRPTSLPAN